MEKPFRAYAILNIPNQPNRVVLKPFQFHTLPQDVFVDTSFFLYPATARELAADLLKAADDAEVTQGEGHA